MNDEMKEPDEEKALSENLSGTNGKKQLVRHRRPVSVAAKRKGSHSDTNRARGPKKSTT